MEWKEHVGWLTLFLAMTDPMHKALMVLFILAFGTALVGGVLGTLLNTGAPNAFLISKQIS
jgi:hypothetical protein